MHKFFCNYNNLTERYELSINRGMTFKNNAQIQAENTLLPEIQNAIQELYENIVELKEKETNEDRLNLLDETELMISNLYYSLFSSPLELPEKKENKSFSIQHGIELANGLLKVINIPEYSRLCSLIKNNLESLLKN